MKNNKFDNIKNESKKYAEEMLDEVYTELVDDLNYSELKFTRDGVQKILELWIEIQLLKDLGITAKSYPDKTKSFFSMRAKAIDFGFDITNICPFINPARLKEHINAILYTLSDDKEQISEFWKNKLGDNNSPSYKKTKKLLRFYKTRVNLQK